MVRRELATLVAAAMAALLVAVPAAAEEPKPDPFAPLRPLVGSWRGAGSGQPGESSVERSYAFVLQGRYLRVENRSIYAPQKQNPKGETHEDVGLFSYDKARKTLVLRQFNVEGFVNQYTLARAAGDGRELVFETEAIENIPAGWRARETYRFLGPDALEETFELAEPGKPFEVYSKTRLTRVK